MRMASTPARVAEEDIRRFLNAGYKTVDETQVVRIETVKYFRYLMTLVTDAGMEENTSINQRHFDNLGGSVTLGTHLSNKDMEDLKSNGHVVNCMGSYQNKTYFLKISF